MNAVSRCRPTICVILLNCLAAYACADEGTVAASEAKQEKIRGEISGFTGQVPDIQIVRQSKNGFQALTVGKRDLQHWDIETGEELGRFELKVRRDAVLSADGTTAFGQDNEGYLFAIKLQSDLHCRRWGHHHEREVTLGISPDGKVAATGGVKEPISIWDIDTGEELSRIDGRFDYVWDIAFSVDGREFVTAHGRFGTTGEVLMRLWDSSTGKLISRLENPDLGNHFFVAGRFVAKSRKLVGQDYSSAIQFWDKDTGKWLEQWCTPEDLSAITAFEISPHSDCLYALCVKKNAKQSVTRFFNTLCQHVLVIWDIQTGEELDRIPGPDMICGELCGGRRAAMCIEAQTVLYIDKNNEVRLWRLPSR